MVIRNYFFHYSVIPVVKLAIKAIVKINFIDCYFLMLKVNNLHYYYYYYYYYLLQVCMLINFLLKVY